MRIRVIDDDAIMLTVARRMLRNERWHVDFAVGGVAGMTALRDRPYDIVLTDFEMPSVSGGEIVNYLRAYVPLTRCVVVTGSPDVARAAFGDVEVIAKPYDPVVLRTVLAGHARALARC